MIKKKQIKKGKKYLLIIWSFLALNESFLPYIQLENSRKQGIFYQKLIHLSIINQLMRNFLVKKFNKLR